MAKSKKENLNEEKNNVLRHCKVQNKKEIDDKINDKINDNLEKVNIIEKEKDNTFRSLTTEEKEYMKSTIPKIEDHERLQLFNFIVMDGIKYTKKSDGILLNLTDANDEFTFKIYVFINKCIENQKYRKI